MALSTVRFGVTAELKMASVRGLDVIFRRDLLVRAYDAVRLRFARLSAREW